jgi:hypothetical protein
MNAVTTRRFVTTGIAAFVLIATATAFAQLNTGILQYNDKGEVTGVVESEGTENSSSPPDTREPGKKETGQEGNG